MKCFLRVYLFFFLFLSVTVLRAHTPLNTDNESNSLETALEIDNPTKSWTLYKDLEEVDYYKIHLHEEEELRVTIYVSLWGDENFTPNLAIIGPDIVGEDEPPIDHPEDQGRVIIQGSRPNQPDYEPFTPASYYYVAAYSHTASTEGDYYIAVYSMEHSGRYGIALGYRETFTLFEWLKIPLDLVRIHLWEEQPIMLLFGPPIATLVLGLYYAFIRVKQNEDVSRSLGKLAGVLFFSSGVMTLTQMVISLLAAGLDGSYLLTLLFVILQIGLGYFSVRESDKTWITWVIIGVSGFVFWAGWLIGPVLAIISAVTKKLDVRAQ